jgi:fructose-1,6-bisphosphatase/inositol monophosphatase family enzyme
MRVALLDEVGEVMRAVASEVIVPRFGSLEAGEIEEKAPGELVTVADREAEQLLSEALLELLPGSRVVGEEQTARQPALLKQLEDGEVWLIDPLDGTANFVEGRPCFAVMVALLSNGETVGAWLLDPLTNTLSRAERGAGVDVEGTRLRTSEGSPGAALLRGAVLKKYMPFELRQQVELRIPRIDEALPGTRCAGAEYPAVVSAPGAWPRGSTERCTDPETRSRVSSSRATARCGTTRSLRYSAERRHDCAFRASSHDGLGGASGWARGAQKRALL